MDLMEIFFISLGAVVVLYHVVKLVLFSRILFPKLWFPLSKSFFTSMGEWAVVTGASEGIGRAYAFALAERGMNVVIMSRTRERLDLVAKEIGEATDQTVKVITTDFINENVFSEIEDQLKDLDIGILVNNVGVLPGVVFEQTQESRGSCITLQFVLLSFPFFQMCKIILPGMEKRGKGLIVNISSGIATVPFPYYSLYAASKIFVERVSQGLQAEYKDKGIIIQAVAPFGVSTRMVSYQKTNIVTLSAENFVKSSLQYIRAGDRTNGSICHSILVRPTSARITRKKRVSIAID
uniref:Hydroxysteroid (17-beta) dehydrogenase 3 n=1 Tax=Salarias fasciatus TaxID=181472 RepID=A0A672GYJ1_SALFA